MSARADSRVLAALAQRDADAPLLRDDRRSRSARELLSRIEALAQAFRAAGVRVMATQIDNAPDWLAIDLALHRCGGVHVPLPTYFSATQCAHALAASGAGHFLGATAPGPAWQATPLADLTCWQTAATAVALPHGCDLITFTSGTTGQPKGVCLSRAALETVAASLVAASADLSPRRHLCVLPLATLLEQIGGLYAPILAGAEIALPGLASLGYSGAAGLDVAALLRTLHRHRPDSVILVPQLLQALVMAAAQGAPLPDTLRLIAVGGGRVGSELLAGAARIGLPVFEGYGLTECASVVCLNRPGASRTGSVGKPLPHARVFADASGELLVDGVRMLGYLGEPALPPGPWSTGDLGHVDDDGFVHIRGRRRNVFITAYGRNVSPEWVEAELVQQPVIAQALVMGEARAFNVAVLVPRDPQCQDASLQAAVDAVNAQLPDYARVGAWLRSPHPFSASQGTLTGNGRLRRDAIALRYREAIEALYPPTVSFIPFLENA